MSEQQVVAIIGQPRWKLPDRYGEVWYYDLSNGGMHMHFQKGKLSGGPKALGLSR